MGKPASALLRLTFATAPREAAALLASSAAAVRTRLYVALRGDWQPLTAAQVVSKLQFVYQEVARSRPVPTRTRPPHQVSL